MQQLWLYKHPNRFLACWTRWIRTKVCVLLRAVFFCFWTTVSAWSSLHNLHIIILTLTFVQHVISGYLGWYNQENWSPLTEARTPTKNCRGSGMFPAVLHRLILGGNVWCQFRELFPYNKNYQNIFDMQNKGERNDWN